MPSVFQALVLGLVQGLTEFLPVSSSAHLAVAPWLAGWQDPGLAFDIALHWGTLLAVLLYFRLDIWNLARGFWHSLWPSTRDFSENIYQKLSWFVVVATIPGAVAGKLLERAAEQQFRAPLLIACTLAVFGVVLFIADRLGTKGKNLDRMTWTDALLVGLAQAFAIVPGVSRSGATIAAALGRGMTRADAARFSFLLSAPIIFGAGVLKLPELRHASDVSGVALAVGFFASAVSGYLAIRFLLRYLSTKSYAVFTWYRLAAAALIVLLWFGRMR